MSLLDRIAETDVAPTCSCGDFARALALVLSVLQDEGVYRTGYRSARADLLAEQLADRKDAYENSRAAAKRWDDNKRRAWANDCVCEHCEGLPLDGWCRCPLCQVLGWVGEKILPHGHGGLLDKKEVNR